MKPLIELRDVEKSYAGATAPVRVLHGVSLTIYPGELVAIMGASGSGKSTLMNILGCLDRPSDGKYLFEGRDIAHFGPDALASLRREAFGFVFQQYQLVSGLSAAQNIEVPAIYRGVPRPERRARVSALLARLGLAQRGEHKPTQLSGGQQQRISIARALMNGGRVLLADEPTGALDKASGQQVMALLRELSASGHTIIMVTHDALVAKQARRVIEISDGQIVADSGRDERASANSELERPIGARRGLIAGGISEAVRAAWQALRLDPARTLLTLLGIVVGVASVVALLGVGEGTKRAVVAELEAFGAHRLYIMPTTDGESQLNGRLTMADVELIKQVPRVAAAMPYLAGSVVVRANNATHRSSGAAVTSDFPQILKWHTQSGAFFDAADERKLATVAVLGSRTAKKLFAAGEDPVRKYVLVDNVPFLVVGVLEPKGALIGDANADDTVVMPFSTASTRIFGTPNLTWVSVSMADSKHAVEVEAAVKEVLSKAHRGVDFEIYNKAAAVAAETRTVNIMTGLLFVTAIISLVVGGIGVMNVMLMTVTERTGEIGVRMAVGASRGDVLAQFLIEAVLLACVGGVLGLFAGWGAGSLCRLLDQQVIFTAPAALLAFCCAVLTGLVCGFLPARRAASLDPVAALARQ